MRTAKKNILVKVSDFSPLEPRIWARVTLIGLPQCLSGLLFAGVYMALTNLTSAVGTAAVAGLGIGHTAEQITFFAGLGFNVAAATLVGQNLGAGRPGRAARAAWTASGIATVYNTLIGLLFFAAPAFIVRIFVDDPDVVAMGGSYLMILALSQPFMALELVLSGAFSGAGNTVPPMVVQAPLTLARVPLALLFIHWGMGAEGIWWAISLSTVARAILMAAWFSLGRWKRKKV